MRPFRRTLRNDRAEVGVGTLIVFIAMVLVAAVAAAVIISTSGTLQQRAMATGAEATHEVSSNLKVINAYGTRASSVAPVHEVMLLLELSAGSQDIPMEEVVLRYSDGQSVEHYYFAHATADLFTLDWIRGGGSDNVFRGGDLVSLTFPVDNLEPRSEFELHIIPESGSSVQLQMKMPATYGSATTITIR